MEKKRQEGEEQLCPVDGCQAEFENVGGHVVQGHPDEIPSLIKLLDGQLSGNEKKPTWRIDPTLVEGKDDSYNRKWKNPHVFFFFFSTSILLF